jgi:hypothetical protein
MGNEFVTPPRLPKVRRRVGTAHLTCPACRKFLEFWKSYVKAVPWKQAQLPVEELGAEDPKFDAGPGEQAEDEHGASENESTSLHERLLQMEEAESIGMLMPHEQALLTAMFTIVHEERRLSWRAVAALAGCSPDRARRALVPALHRWHTLCGPNDRLVFESQTTITRIRGARQPDVWRRHTFRLGSKEVSWSERVTDRTERQAALATRHSLPERTYRQLPTTTMRSLTNALALHLAGLKIPDDAETRHLRESPDWNHNLAWAERKLKRARSRSTRPITSVADVLRVLGRTSPLCRACRTPILVGCHVSGRTVSRAREFCCDACKMHVQRRRGRRQAGRAVGGGSS